MVSITPSLATALKHLRSYHYDFLELHSLPLWIDAICINQADLDERIQQVRLMGRIYRHVSRVVLWVGKGDRLSDRAVDQINDRVFRAHSIRLKVNSEPAPTPEQVMVQMIIEENLEKRRYWTRTWVLQEVVLATQDPVMLCGSRRVPWSHYALCKKVFSSMPSSYYKLAPNWAAVREELLLNRDVLHTSSSTSVLHENIRRNYQNCGSIPMGTLLTMTASLVPTDPRDHIYGVLGLVPESEILMMDVDYKKSPELVFRDAMTAIWTSVSTDRLIAYTIPLLIFPCLANDTSEVPSWAPDLSRRTEQLNSLSSLMAKPQPWRREGRAEIHVEGRILTIKAFQFDSIADSVEVNFDHGWSETFHRGKTPGEVDIEPLQEIEALAQRGLNTPIPASSRLTPFSVLIDKEPISKALTSCEDNENWFAGVDIFRRVPYKTNRLPAGAGGNEGVGRRYKPDIPFPTIRLTASEFNYQRIHREPQDRENLWEILLGRQQIPEAWKRGCSPELRSSPSALEAALLSPLLRAISKKVNDRKVFISRSGFLGVGTKQMDVGDIITLVVGMKCMYVLRPFNDGYRIVGFASVSGLMEWDDLDEVMKAGSLHEEEMKIY